jgi:ferredoxin
LLGTLGDHKIFIPSACGGKGACGVCEVIVKEGGGTLLPTETGFINRGEAKRGCRLACQVKVKRDMASRSRPRSSTCASGTARWSPTATSPPSSRNSSWPCPRAKKCPSAPAAMCSWSARRTTSSFKSFDIEQAVPRRLGQVRPLALQVGGRAHRTRLFDGQLPAGKGPVLLFTIRIAFPPGYKTKSRRAS